MRRAAVSWGVAAFPGPRLGSTLAIVLSALAFGLFHIHPVHVAVATLTGIVCSVVMTRGGLGAAIATHAANNLFTLILIVVAFDSPYGLGMAGLGALLLVAGLTAVLRAPPPVDLTA